MPQPDHVTALDDADEATLPDDLKPYFQKCRDKLGFVPNVSARVAAPPREAPHLHRPL